MTACVVNLMNCLTLEMRIFSYVLRADQAASACVAGLFSSLLLPAGHASEARDAPHGISEARVVGGHAGMLRDPEQMQVLKPIRNRLGHAEATFYRFAFDAKRRHVPPATFMPQYFGVSTLHTDGGDSGHAAAYIALEDITSSFRRPTVMDIKVGVQTWDEDAPEAKVAQELAKYPTQQAVGFRVTGMRVWDTRAGEYREHGRAYGYSLDASTLSAAFTEFLWDGAVLRLDVARALLSRLDDITTWVEAQGEFRFYGSSLLVVYEGDVEPEDAARVAGRAAAVHSFIPHSRHGVRVAGPPTAPPPARVDVRMIDFAHVWPIRDGEEGRDAGYLLGLQSVRAYLQQALREAEGAGSGADQRLGPGGHGRDAAAAALAHSVDDGGSRQQ